MLNEAADARIEPPRDYSSRQLCANYVDRETPISGHDRKIQNFVGGLFQGCDEISSTATSGDLHVSGASVERRERVYEMCVLRG